MVLIDAILNVAGLLLWLSWRTVGLDPFVRTVPATLGGTIRRAESTRFRRWHFLAALGGLLLLRAVIYSRICPALNWTPRLDLVFVALAFRGDVLATMLLFSGLSFLRLLIVFYFWLLFLALVNRRHGAADPCHKAIQLQLGRPARWPWWVQLIFPILAVAALWMAFHPLLVHLGVIGPTQLPLHLAEQGLLVGTGLYFSLKYLLPAFLFLHLVVNYVYLGNSPVWPFITLTARSLLAPLSRVPLRAGKMDFAPLVGIALVLLALHFLPEWIRMQMIQSKLPVWPQ